MERQIILELLFLTLSGTALGLLFCLFRPLTGKVFSFRWHYYLWLIVLLRLILPVHVDMGIFPAPAVFSPAQTPDGRHRRGRECCRRDRRSGS